MTTAGKWIIGIIVVLVLAAAGWWYWGATSPSSREAPSAATSGTQPTTGSAATSGSATTLGTPPSDNSNAAIQEDAASVDTQMQGLTTDSAAVDQGLNDQPVQQSSL